MVGRIKKHVVKVQQSQRPPGAFPLFFLGAVSLKQNGPPLSFAAIYPLQTRRLLPTAYLPVGATVGAPVHGQSLFRIPVDMADHPASCPS